MTTAVEGSAGWRTPVMIVAVVLIVAAAALTFAFLQLSDDADSVANNPEATPTVEAGATGPTGPIGGPTGPTGPSGGLTGATGPTGPSSSSTPGGSSTPSSSVTPSIPTPSGTSTPRPTTTPDTGGSGSGGIDDWPSGETAYTVILYSGTTRAQAESKARGYTGLSDVGVLNSDDFSTLRSGYWVVFSGQYDTLSAAQSAARRAQSQANGAYAKQVKPK